eukprot:CAMPEP_0196571218 /NCGR_PEP_ID=MMETSP1081-20130531/1397_1 /TAXON_ID=36882 /ORGANISM="Pyramimonas amylifera, Strain CCMP720" /LENGTH=279 /DNA_ID=CAMNT_0041888059 /DNA_START=157 /DNA_END=993 /DNA_ORIENTATION=-
MTDYNKWDKFVADLSDEEDCERAVDQSEDCKDLPPVQEVKAGVGGALSAEGKIQHSDWRPGNARGNALSTNADVGSKFSITDYTWEEHSEPGAVLVQVPLKALGTVIQDKVRCSFSERSVSLAVETEERKQYELMVEDFPCEGIEPTESSFRVQSSGGKAQVSTNQVWLRLKKQKPKSTWGSLGRLRQDKKRPMVTITDYSWADFKKSCKVWIKIKGVQNIPASQITSRFRELSFDITVCDLNGKDFQYAITELPMEVVVEECYHEVEEDQIKIFLKKW